MKDMTEIGNEINAVMENFYCIEDMTVEKAKELLTPQLNNLIERYERFHLPTEDDWSSGEETYGYENDESILGTLRYISDRWGASFRVRWMIDLIDPTYYANRGIEE